MSPKIANKKLTLRKATIASLTALNQVRGGMMASWSRCYSKCVCPTDTEDSDCC